MKNKDIDSKLDKILDLLYDEGELLFKQVPSTDIVIFGKQKFNLDWNDSDVLFIMNVLQDEGYVILNKGDFTGSRMKMPTYSLTSKGIRLKQNGGFVFKRRIEWWTNFLIISASIVTIVVGLATSIDFYFKYLSSPSEVTNEAENSQTITYPTPNSQFNIELSNTEKTTDNENTDNNPNQNKMDTITDSHTVADPIQKTSIRPTKK